MERIKRVYKKNTESIKREYGEDKERIRTSARFTHHTGLAVKA